MSIDSTNNVGGAVIRYDLSLKACLSERYACGSPPDMLPASPPRTTVDVVSLVQEVGALKSGPESSDGGGGHPISKAYWGRIWGGDTERDVLVHVFECRVIPSPPR